MSNNIEDIIGSLYDMVQDARAMPLAADKCILERDRVLDMLDEIIAQLPGELKQSRTIVESRNELINQARREAEGIIRQAQEQAKQMVTKEAIYAEAKKRCEELVGQTQNKINQLRKAGNNMYTGGQPQEAANSQVMQGYLETSNVNIAQEVVDMIVTYRAYESSQQAVKMIDQTLNRAVNDIAKF